MINACEVYLWDTRIGVVYQDDPFGAARFEYDMRFQYGKIYESRNGQAL